MTDTFNDLMGITIETGDAWLDKKLNSHICYKGGTKALSNLPQWATNLVKSGAEGAGSAHESGDFSRVAGLAGEQTEALDAARGIAGRQDRLAEQSRAGVNTLSSIASGDKDFEQSIINQANLAEGDRIRGGGANTVGGSSTDARARAFGRARLGDSLQQARAGAASQLGAATTAQQQAEGAGAGTLYKAGEARRAHEQQQLDAPYTGYQRLFGLYGNVLPQAGQSHQTGGK